MINFILKRLVLCFCCFLRKKLLSTKISNKGIQITLSTPVANSETILNPPPETNTPKPKIITLNSTETKSWTIFSCIVWFISKTILHPTKNTKLKSVNFQISIWQGCCYVSVCLVYFFVGQKHFLCQFLLSQPQSHVRWRVTSKSLLMHCFVDSNLEFEFAFSDITFKN